MTSSALDALLVLQDFDLAIDQARHRRNHLAERSELEGIRATVDAIQADLAATEGTRDELAKREGEVEAELAATEARRKAVSQRLYGGEVSASRELQAMATDLESLKERASGLEDVVLELLEEREPLDLRVDELAGRLAELEVRRLAASEQLTSGEHAVDGEIAELEGKRRQAAGDVEGALLDAYEKIRVRKEGIGVARIFSGRCGGCHLALSAVELDHIRHLPPGEVAYCEQCSRILVL